MDVQELAARVLNQADVTGQSAVRTDSSTPIGELRSEIRRIARARGLRIRTGMLHGHGHGHGDGDGDGDGDVLVVVRVDAALWDEPTAIMRQKLAAPDEPNVVADPSVQEIRAGSDPNGPARTSP
jgi:hypothetical protein